MSMFLTENSVYTIMGSMHLSKTIFLIRHGTTEFNQKSLMQGRLDNTINQTGREEVERLAAYLKNEPFDLIFHSPMKRALQTAEIVNSRHQVPLSPVEEFVEIDLGDWEGKPYPETFVKEQDFHHRWLLDPDLPLPGGESFQQVADRVKPGVARILDTDFTTCAIVGHATVNRGILAALLGLSAQPARYFRMKNGAYSKLLIYETTLGRHTIVDSWNRSEF